MKRCQFLRLIGSMTATAAVSRRGSAADYPSRLVRLIVAFAAGGPNDIVARLMAQYLSERLGIQFAIENRPGASSNVATDVVIKSPPDGCTLLVVNASNAINATLYENLNYVFMRDIVAVAALVRVPNVVEVHPSLPIRSIADLIAYAKANPGKLNAASGGVGSTVHLSTELFKMMTGTNIVHVPYRGSAPAMVDLLAGQMQLMFDAMPSSIGYIKAGGVRALAVTSTERSEALPDLPTVNDTVAGYEANSWYGIGAPKGTPTEIVELLNDTVNAGLTDPALKAKYAALGATTLPGSREDFASLIADETEKWARVVRFSGAKANHYQPARKARPTGQRATNRLEPLEPGAPQWSSDRRRSDDTSWRVRFHAARRHTARRHKRATANGSRAISVPCPLGRLHRSSRERPRGRMRAICPRSSAVRDARRNSTHGAFATANCTAGGAHGLARRPPNGLQRFAVSTPRSSVISPDEPQMFAASLPVHGRCSERITASSPIGRQSRLPQC